MQLVDNSVRRPLRLPLHFSLALAIPSSPPTPRSRLINIAQLKRPTTTGAQLALPAFSPSFPNNVERSGLARLRRLRLPTTERRRRDGRLRRRRRDGSRRARLRRLLRRGRRGRLRPCSPRSRPWPRRSERRNPHPKRARDGYACCAQKRRRGIYDGDAEARAKRSVWAVHDRGRRRERLDGHAARVPRVPTRVVRRHGQRAGLEEGVLSEYGGDARADLPPWSVDAVRDAPKKPAEHAGEGGADGRARGRARSREGGGAHRGAQACEPR
ncbi:hypothetical protein CC85DRAFT_95136 [Cutaneotrichosporon oleaginosum]|uniref:Uncharacterized protein n=1 Tax=Cutaneotrichosporon oleaginosum TaxID=879819 RepID=A0A0J1B3P8_9TREE|nr:uncharacterized protein CC85DRAFT_95136 [Cutaneotrichosporon oleaginosum]KLT42279.1 hypothetical protein CC85DRAFT_95136 [Cutaneotrichosporon oleaginosum]TXT11451.1 hypothetical protein COLE_01861 [Cutaneotrichosporon oleaginosum]